MSAPATPAITGGVTTTAQRNQPIRGLENRVISLPGTVTFELTHIPTASQVGAGRDFQKHDPGRRGNDCNQDPYNDKAENGRHSTTAGGSLTSEIAR